MPNQLARTIVIALTALCQAPLARGQDRPHLAFRTEPAEGPGETRAAVLEARPEAVLVRGRLVIGDLCRRLRASVLDASDSTIVLLLQTYDRPGAQNMLCDREEQWVRYVAEVSPICAGKVRVAVQLQDLRPEHELLAATLVVPRARPRRGCAA